MYNAYIVYDMKLCKHMHTVQLPRNSQEERRLVNPLPVRSGTLRLLSTAGGFSSRWWKGVG